MTDREREAAAVRAEMHRCATEAWERAKADPTSFEAAVCRSGFEGNEAVERVWLDILRRRHPGASWAAD